MADGTGFGAGLRVAVVLTIGLFVLSPAGAGQSAGVNQGGPEYLHAPAGLSPLPQKSSSPTASPMDQMRQAEQHRHIAADTAKLVDLSNQLKIEVDRSSKDQLSVEALRTTAEIEKTAHDLKGWLKN